MSAGWRELPLPSSLPSGRALPPSRKRMASPQRKTHGKGRFYGRYIPCVICHDSGMYRRTTHVSRGCMLLPLRPAQKLARRRSFVPRSALCLPSAARQAAKSEPCCARQPKPTYTQPVSESKSEGYVPPIPPRFFRQSAGLHVRSPYGVRLTDEQTIAYDAALVHSLGGETRACCRNAVAGQTPAGVVTHADSMKHALDRGFWLVDAPAPPGLRAGPWTACPGRGTKAIASLIPLSWEKRTRPRTKTRPNGQPF